MSGAVDNQDRQVAELFSWLNGCFCGKRRCIGEMEFQCFQCEKWIHHECINSSISDGKMFGFLADYTFLCKNCIPGGGRLELHPTGFARMAVTVLADMRWNDHVRAVVRNDVSVKYFSLVSDVWLQMDIWWDSLTTISNPKHISRKLLIQRMAAHPELFELKIINKLEMCALLIDNLAHVSPLHEKIFAIDRNDGLENVCFRNALTNPKFLQNFNLLSFTVTAPECGMLMGPTLDMFLNKKRYEAHSLPTGIIHGLMYHEMVIVELPENSSVNVGFTRKEKPLAGYLGRENDAYAFRVPLGLNMNAGRGKEVFEKDEECPKSYKANDKVGCLIYLPLVRTETRADGKEIIPGSMIAFSVNDVFWEPAYENIEYGTYFPAVSFSGNAKVAWRAGHKWPMLSRAIENLLAGFNATGPAL